MVANLKRELERTIDTPDRCRPATVRLDEARAGTRPSGHVCVRSSPAGRKPALSVSAFSPHTTSDLNRTLRACGLACLAVYVVFIPLSIGIAAVAPFSTHQDREAEAFRALVNAGWIPSMKVVHS